MTQPRLGIVPCSIKEACAFIEQHHRHHKPPNGGLFAVSVADESGVIRGVAIVARPIVPQMWDGFTAEVTRCATDGCENACSALYGAAWRAARALGYRKLITYTLQSESGASLRGAGWRVVAEVKAGRTWNMPGRPRVDKAPLQAKFRWEVSA